MFRRIVFPAAIFALFAAGCSQPHTFPQGRWIDLSYEYSSETIYWPTAEGFQHVEDFAGFTDQGYYYTSNSFSTSEHGGTHIDAPIHFAEGARTLDEIPLEQLIGPAVVIDVSEKALSNRDYLIRIEDITSWEAVHGRIPDHAILFFRTGFGRYWPDPVQYLGTDKRGEEGIAELHFPGLSPETAQWLVDNRTIGAIGIDTASIDYGQSKMEEVHQIIYPHNIPGFENVANLDQLPETGTFVVALPMKIKGGSGGPLRIAALVPE